jgi:hypothetical protein
MAKIFRNSPYLNIAYIEMTDGRVRPIDQFYILDATGKVISKFRWFCGGAGTNNGYSEIAFQDFNATTIKKDISAHAPFVTSKLVKPVFGSSHKTLGEKGAVDVYLPAEWFDISEYVRYVSENGEAFIMNKIVYKKNPEVFTDEHNRFESGWL